jgi:hypothetical protein
MQVVALLPAEFPESFIGFLLSPCKLKPLLVLGQVCFCSEKQTSRDGCCLVTQRATARSLAWISGGRDGRGPETEQGNE